MLTTRKENIMSVTKGYPVRGELFVKLRAGLSNHERAVHPSTGSGRTVKGHGGVTLSSFNHDLRRFLALAGVFSTAFACFLPGTPTADAGGLR